MKEIIINSYNNENDKMMYEQDVIKLDTNIEINDGDELEFDFEDGYLIIRKHLLKDEKAYVDEVKVKKEDIINNVVNNLIFLADTSYDDNVKLKANEKLLEYFK